MASSESSEVPHGQLHPTPNAPQEATRADEICGMYFTIRQEVADWIRSKSNPYRRDGWLVSIFDCRDRCGDSLWLCKACPMLAFCFPPDRDDRAAARRHRSVARFHRARATITRILSATLHGICGRAIRQDQEREAVMDARVRRNRVRGTVGYFRVTCAECGQAGIVVNSTRSPHPFCYVCGSSIPDESFWRCYAPYSRHDCDKVCSQTPTS